MSRGFTTQDGTTVTSSQQLRNAPDMIGMHMGEYQYFHGVESKLNGINSGRLFSSCRFQQSPTIDEQAVMFIHMQLMT
ncbi:hypothetical protein CFII64_02621 [Pseudomonas sp. CFII64]|nr:hypothetical protein CFII64_02621 [Pseudomonas sp. CFII64]